MYINLDSVPWHAAAGGLMIGAAVALLFYLELTQKV